MGVFFLFTRLFDPVLGIMPGDECVDDSLPHNPNGRLPHTLFKCQDYVQWFAAIAAAQ